MFCRNCGAQNKNDANFCQACGSDLRTMHQIPKKTQGFVIVIIGIVFLVVISWIAGTFLQHKNESEIKLQYQEFEEKNQTGNNVNAYSEYLSESKTEQEYVTAEDISNFFSECVFYGDKKYTILPNDYGGVFEFNDDESGCMGKRISLFADKWVVYINYGLTKDAGIMELPYITTVGTSEKLKSVAKEITSVYGKGECYYIENETIYVWTKAIDNKYDLWLSKKKSEERIYIDFIKCINDSDHNEEGIRDRLSESIEIDRDSDEE